MPEILTYLGCVERWPLFAMAVDEYSSYPCLSISFMTMRIYLALRLLCTAGGCASYRGRSPSRGEGAGIS